ncbi:DNA/RNA non-specific endonuclease [Desulfovibrio mangrovi]|uniref:DNA/RNA non-specific endonuclease n=1 Tax=Desulfovibrio mangrovi TaxID=2976983 RepID=UPI002247C36D|nr:DNA/RNA non-specific endonuclease [Desulfovibrio mangrovi]UZP68723.1 DNA/RNA non-specific endonuclease [Desulfovibrio mangrovi]
MRKLTVAFVCALAVLVSAAYAQDGVVYRVDPYEQVQFGLPEGTSSQNLIVRRVIYVLSNNPYTKFADWVGYKLDVNSVTGASERDRNWKRDPDLPKEETLSPSDYDGAFNALKMDRGHQAPLASFKGTPYWWLTNYLSNITPQRMKLNRGPWAKLEHDVRSLAEREPVYVITGTLYEREMPKLPNAKKDHQIPSGYWKIIGVEDLDARPGQPPMRVAGYIFEQNATESNPMSQYLVTVDEIERRTGFNFYPDLPDDVEELMESCNTLEVQ